MLECEKNSRALHSQNDSFCDRIRRSVITARLEKKTLPRRESKLDSVASRNVFASMKKQIESTFYNLGQKVWKKGQKSVDEGMFLLDKQISDECLYSFAIYK